MKVGIALGAASLFLVKSSGFAHAVGPFRAPARALVLRPADIGTEYHVSTSGRVSPTVIARNDGVSTRLIAQCGRIDGFGVFMVPDRTTRSLFRVYSAVSTFNTPSGARTYMFRVVLSKHNVHFMDLFGATIDRVRGIGSFNRRFIWNSGSRDYGMIVVLRNAYVGEVAFEARPDFGLARFLAAEGKILDQRLKASP